MGEASRTNRTRMAFRRIAGGWIAATLAACGMVGCSLRGEVRPLTSAVPVATVKRADFQLEVHATGTLRATQSVILRAPPIAGGTLQIIRLASDGTPVKPGQVVAAFDPSQQQYNLAQSRSDFEQAQQEIIQAKDNAAVQVAEDQTALLKAQFAVRQAQLNVKMNEMVSAIEAKENLLALDAANRTLAQTQHDIQSHAVSNQAALSVAQQKLEKARLAIDQARQNLAKMQLKSPIAGLVVVLENYAASGGFYFQGMRLPEFQIGDQIGPGASVAEVIDIDRLELNAQILQADRTNVETGDPVEIRIDAIPNVAFTGRVQTVAGMASPGFFGTASQATVNAGITLDHPDPRLRPGFSAHLVILGRRLQNVLTVPREALFDLTGTPAVYVQEGSGFKRQPVKIRYLTHATAVIAGLDPGTEVALANPERQSAAQSSHPPAAAAPALGAGGH